MAWSTKAKKNKYQARVDKAEYHRWRAAGCCVRCGLPTRLNKRGLPYVHCFDHQLFAAKHTKKFLDKKRNQRKVQTL